MMFPMLALFALALCQLETSKAMTMSQVSKIKRAVWDAELDHGVLQHAVSYSKPNIVNAPQACTSGSITLGSNVHACDNVDFLSFIALSELTIQSAKFPTGSSAMSDVWGWTGPSGEEITIACLDNGVVFIDSTDPVDPVILGKIETGKNRAPWCDVKVYQDTVYISKDQNGLDTGGQTTYGLEVFNLTRLIGVTPGGTFLPDSVYDQHGRAHNVVINPDSGFLYSVGSNTCSGGLHMIDLNTNPLEPTFVGCADADGYTHDAQCVNYVGPDSRYTGNELCFAFNEDSLTIYNVSDKVNPVIVSRTCYEKSEYSHQGWLSDDMTTVFLDDELDEFSNTRPKTSTYMFDVSDLENVQPIGLFEHPTETIDHNLYLWGSIIKRGLSGNPPESNHPSLAYAYFANYLSGLRICDVSSANQLDVTQVGFFDVSPNSDATSFFGAWSTYMHPSGVIAVTTIESGVFFLNFTEAFVEPTGTSGIALATASVKNTCPTNSDQTPFFFQEFLLGALSLVAVFALAASVYLFREKGTAGQVGVKGRPPTI